VKVNKSSVGVAEVAEVIKEKIKIYREAAGVIA
jgi:hypothetical protein